ncbi:MAG: NAD(P)-binding domain-containing protein [Nanoarchaeota archaeon]|nr:NAD(P)-binding domain-containing protein [Nanoarchaeota archaeon]
MNIVTIVGAGPAGIGIGILLQKIGVQYEILEKETVGSSFKNWPKQMKFISPSFTTNYYGFTDLNAICPDTSPAFALHKTFPSGEEYAQYLQGVSEFYELNITKKTQVLSIEQEEDTTFKITIKQGSKTSIITSKYVIWAVGEFSFPNLDIFEGSEFCVHNSTISNWENFVNKNSIKKNEEYIVIGGYESGADATYNLAKLENKVTIFEKNEHFLEHITDPSKTLSPSTIERLEEVDGKFRVFEHSVVNKVEFDKVKKEYIIHYIQSVEDEKTQELVHEQRTHTSKTQPILATGFVNNTGLIKDLCSYDEKGSVNLNDVDQTINTPNLYISGPQVRQGNILFCFIYKFRQRFPVIVENICKKEGINCKEVIDYYKEQHMYLYDLSCCEEECNC